MPEDRGSTESLSGYAYRFLPGSRVEGPVLLLLHGTGGDENDLLPLGGILSPGSPLLSPRGNVLENHMPRFFRRHAEGVFDVPDLERRTHQLAAFIARAREAHGLRDRPILAAGFSNGANIAASMLLLSPESLSGAILFRPMVPFEPQALPALAGKPVFLSAGRADPVAPPEHAEKLAALLRSAGADATLQWDASGHGLDVSAVRIAAEWVKSRFESRERPS